MRTAEAADSIVKKLRRAKTGSEIDMQKWRAKTYGVESLVADEVAKAEDRLNDLSGRRALARERETRRPGWAGGHRARS